MTHGKWLGSQRLEGHGSDCSLMLSWKGKVGNMFRDRRGGAVEGSGGIGGLGLGQVGLSLSHLHALS